MKIETRHSIGDKVFSIIHATRGAKLPCPACMGAGEIEYPDGEKRSCSKCFGRGTEIEWVQGHWYVNAELTIGQVRYQYPSRDSAPDSYMCRETGIGSGSVYYGDTLFSTIEAAQHECDVRNEALGADLDRWNELVKQGKIVNEPIIGIVTEEDDNDNLPES